MTASSRARAVRRRNGLSIGASVAALGAALVLAGPAAAQAAGQGSDQAADQSAGSKVPDAADSSATAGNPNEAGSAPDQQAAAAAAAGDATPAQDAAAGGQDIVVTGFRRSLETAVAEKKNRDQVIESVSAEDIGKLPDASIAESIARLPGLTAQRASGRDTTISIRGFAPDFSTTLLNGREQTSTGDNRAVEYDQYPAEVINQVLVYKTGQASLVGQGLSGTVDLRTIRPLEFGRRVISVGARGSYDDKGRLNPDADKYGYRANAVYVDQFADDKVGLSLAASYSHEPYEIEEFNAWGYFNPDASGNAAISGSKSYNTSTTLERFGVVGTLEVRPTPEFTSTFDGFYSHFNDDQFHRGIELPFSYFGAVFNPATATAGDGLYTSGAFNNVQGVVRNNAFQRRANLYSFGWNNAWKGDDGWNATLDVSYSKTKRNERDLESYSGTGYNWSGNVPGNNDVTDTIGFASGGRGTSFTHGLNYSDPGLILLTDPLGWGGSTIQAGYNNNRVIDDRIWQYRAEVERELDEGSFFSSVQFGVNYTNHDKSLDPQENFLVLASGATQQAIPSELIKKSTNLGYLGLGPILTYDPFQLIDAGVYALRSNAVPDVFAKQYGINEDLMTLYLQGNIKQQVGAATLTGNVGLQAIDTSQHSSGNYIRGDGALVPYRDGDDYWDLLPSVNLSLRFPSDLVVRAAAARQVVRPRMDDMRASLSYGTTNDPATGAIIPSGSRGDPRLRPYRSNSYDVTFEKYFGSKGYLAAQLFYKQLKSYVLENQQVAFDYTGFTFTGQQPSTTAGFVTQPINVKGGHVRGVELAGTLPLGEFASALDGFGLTGSGSYTKSKIQFPGLGSGSLPGYSKWVANGTAFFEKWGFSARGSVRYRSKFTGEVVGFGDSRVLRQAAPETIVDGQVGYEFGDGLFKGLYVYVQGQNLTDERFKTYQPGNRLEVIDYQEFGRRFLAGFTLKL